jgi:thiol-disulfide isomerase/thioredoxin
MRRRSVSWVLGVLLFAGVVAAADAPETDQFGKPQDLGQGPGVTVVDFAASWCEPCWKTLPRLQEMAQEMPSIRFVVVDVDEKVEGRDELVKRLGLTMPVVWDAQQRLAEHFQPEGMPATFVLDGGGKVLYKHVGSDPKDWDRLAAFLAGKKG